MNEEFEDDYDDMDDMGTPPLSDRRRRSAPELPQFHWTLEKVSKISNSDLNQRPRKSPDFVMHPRYDKIFNNLNLVKWNWWGINGGWFRIEFQNSPKSTQLNAHANISFKSQKSSSFLESSPAIIQQNAYTFYDSFILRYDSSTTTLWTLITAASTYALPS